MMLQENGHRSDVTFLVHTFWTPPYSENSATARTQMATMDLCAAHRRGVRITPGRNGDEDENGNDEVPLTKGAVVAEKVRGPIERDARLMINRNASTERNA